MKLLKLEKHMCRFCGELGRMLEGMEIPHEVKNMDDEPEYAAKYRVMSAPVLILMDDNGNEIDRVEGFFRPQVEELLEKFQG
jgi:thioredoxin 1